MWSSKRCATKAVVISVYFAILIFNPGLPQKETKPYRLQTKEPLILRSARRQKKNGGLLRVRRLRFLVGPVSRRSAPGSTAGPRLRLSAVLLRFRPAVSTSLCGDG